MQAIRPNDVLYLDYGVEEEPWHERFIVDFAAGSDWLVLTPDGDLYVETIAVPPLSGVRIGPGDWRLPAGLGSARGQPVYRFRERPTEAGLRALREEGRRLIAIHRAQVMPLPDLEFGDPAPSFPPPGPPLPPPGPPPPSVVDGTWISIDPRAPWAVGMVFSAEHKAGFAYVEGNMGLVRCGNGAAWAAQKVEPGREAATIEELRSLWSSVTPRDGGAREPDPPADAGGLFEEDARTLPVARNSAGERYRDLRSVSETCSEVPFDDWALAGPRTMRWWLQQVARTGNGVVARHQTWKHENNLKDDDHLCQLHEVLSEVVELLACVDQVDPGNLCGMEAAARHLQFVEYEVKKKADSKRSDSKAEFFLGRSKRTGGALISPELLKWVSDKAAQESAVLKEQRKAAEERALARKKDKN